MHTEDSCLPQNAVKYDVEKDHGPNCWTPNRYADENRARLVAHPQRRMAAVRDLAITIQHLIIPIRRENSLPASTSSPNKVHQLPLSSKPPLCDSLYSEPSLLTKHIQYHPHPNHLDSPDVKSAVNHSPSRSTQPQLHTLTSTPHHTTSSTTSSTNHGPTKSFQPVGL